MHEPSPSRDLTTAGDERSASEGIQRAVIRIACAVFAIMAGIFAVIASALAPNDQAVFLTVGLAAIVASRAVIRTELRRKRQLEQR